MTVIERSRRPSPSGVGRDGVGRARWPPASSVAPPDRAITATAATAAPPAEARAIFQRDVMRAPSSAAACALCTSDVRRAPGSRRGKNRRRWPSRSPRRSSRCWPSWPARSPTATAGCSSRSGTASAASCSATATTSSWPAATSGRSPATSPSCSTRSGPRCPARCVVDGEIVVADRDGRGLDFDALLQRIHPAESRVRRLAAETPASYVAFDLLALDDDVLLERPLSRAPRRAAAASCARRRRSTSRRRAPTAATAAEWFGRFEGAGLDGVVAKRLDDPYQPDKRALVKVKHERTADCVVAGYRIHKDGNGVGSLLLGLYDDEDRLQHVGVAASFSVKFRAELLAELEPLTHDAVDDHPWRDWAEWQHTDAGPQAGRDEPVERRQGPVVGADPRRAGRRGDVRAAREAALPPRRVVRPLAPRPRAGELPLRPARRRRPGAVRGPRRPG